MQVHDVLAADQLPQFPPRSPTDATNMEMAFYHRKSRGVERDANQFSRHQVPNQEG